MGRCERVVAADGPQCVLMRSSNTFFGGSKFAALHMSARGTELPIPNVRSSVANEGKADKICSMRVLRILIPISVMGCQFCCAAQRPSQCGRLPHSPRRADVARGGPDRRSNIDA